MSSDDTPMASDDVRGDVEAPPRWVRAIVAVCFVSGVVLSFLGGAAALGGDLMLGWIYSGIGMVLVFVPTYLVMKHRPDLQEEADKTYREMKDAGELPLLK